MNNRSRKLLFDVLESARSHGYDVIDDATVWGVIDARLPQLLTQVEAMLQEGG